MTAKMNVNIGQGDTDIVQNTLKMAVNGYAAVSNSIVDMKPVKFDRFTPGESDVCFDIAFCGICHTDVHFIRNDLGISQYPLVPGHELTGTVTAVGSKVTKFKEGDPIGLHAPHSLHLQSQPGEGFKPTSLSTNSSAS